MKYVLYYIVLISLLFAQIITLAQVSSGEQPLSFTKKALLNKEIPTIKLPLVDVATLQKEDELLDGENRPYRFGQPIAMAIGLGNAGCWETLPNGDRIWRLRIESPTAKSLNLIYNDFYLPSNAKFHLYSEDSSQLLGAFTEVNNKSHRKFSTGLIKGKVTILEYFEPKAVKGKGSIQIEKVIHGYRGIRTLEKSFGDSGSCNINVNCEEGLGWQNEKQAVAMILTSGGFRFCSGAMLNNARQDCSPYFLTANHCLSGSESTWLFMFNYESPSCENIDGVTNQTVSGATVLAADERSDFALVELSLSPPIDYNVYYAGWSAIDQAAPQTTGIHHPSGDIKKISFNDDFVTTTTSSGGATNSYWEVDNWEKGTTEGGSSGSPIFDQNRRIIGQLLGGFAACGNSEYDVYGKFAYSWTVNEGSENNLKTWLDPQNAGLSFINGRFCEATTSLDASIINIVAPSETYCNVSTISPIIEIRNQGGTSLTELTITYIVDNEAPITTIWSGNLSYLTNETVNLATSPITGGNHQLTIYLTAPNGQVDMNMTNDTLTQIFQILEEPPTNVTITTDDYSIETSYDIKDEAGNVIVSNSNLLNNTQNEFEYCLGVGCYTFTIYDSFGDGICCLFGEGSYSLTLPNDMVISGTGEFNTQATTSFCISSNSIVASFVSDKTTTCLQDTITFSALYQDAAHYDWTVENGQIIGEENQPTIQVTYTISGIHDVLLTVEDSVGNLLSEEKQDYITILSSPIVELTNVTNAATPISQDGFASVAVIGGQAPYVFSWDGINSGVNNFYGSLTSGEHEVLVRDANGCETSLLFTIDSDILPAMAGFITEKDTLCENDSITFTNLSGGDITWQRWMFEGGVPDTSTAINPIVSYPLAGSYDVQLIVGNEYTTDTLTFVDYISILPIPIVEITVTNTAKEINTGEIVIEPVNNLTNLSYSWNTGSEAEQVVNLPSAIYTVTITDENNCFLQEHIYVGKNTTPDLLVYSNPAYQAIRVYNNQTTDIPATFELYNLMGQKVWGVNLKKGENIFYPNLITSMYLAVSTVGEERKIDKIFFVRN